MPKKSLSKTFKPELQSPDVATWESSKKTKSKAPKQVLKKPALAKEKPSSTPKTTFGQEIDDIFSKKRKNPEQLKTSKLDKRSGKDSKDKEPEKRKKKRSRSEGSNVDMFESEQPVRPKKKTADGLAIYTEDELGFGKADAGGTRLCPFDCDCCF